MFTQCNVTCVLDQRFLRFDRADEETVLIVWTHPSHPEASNNDAHGDQESGRNELLNALHLFETAEKNLSEQLCLDFVELGTEKIFRKPCGKNVSETAACGEYFVKQTAVLSVTRREHTDCSTVCEKIKNTRRILSHQPTHTISLSHSIRQLRQRPHQALQQARLGPIFQAGIRRVQGGQFSHKFTLAWRGSMRTRTSTLRIFKDGVAHNRWPSGKVNNTLGTHVPRSSLDGFFFLVQVIPGVHQKKRGRWW